MLGKNSSIVVVGAGAIGGVTAAFMRENGYNVEIVCKYPELVQTIAKRGIHITGVRGDMAVPMPAVASIRDLKGKKDVIFLATKATDMLAAAKELLPFMKTDSVLVSLQNGLC